MFLQVLEHIARRNGRTITLELEDLQAIFGDTTSKPAPSLPTNIWNAFSGMFLYVVCFNMISAAESSAAHMSVHSFLTGAWQLIRPLSSLSGGMYIKKLCILPCWPVDAQFNRHRIPTLQCLPHAYLPLYLSAQGSASGSSSMSETYCNYSIVSVLGIPRSLIACALRTCWPHTHRNAVRVT